MSGNLFSSELGGGLSSSSTTATEREEAGAGVRLHVNTRAAESEEEAKLDAEAERAERREEEEEAKQAKVLQDAKKWAQEKAKEKRQKKAMKEEEEEQAEEEMQQSDLSVSSKATGVSRLVEIEQNLEKAKERIKMDKLAEFRAPPAINQVVLEAMHRPRQFNEATLVVAEEANVGEIFHAAKAFINFDLSRFLPNLRPADKLYVKCMSRLSKAQEIGLARGSPDLLIQEQDEEEGEEEEEEEENSSGDDNNDEDDENGDDGAAVKVEVEDDGEMDDADSDENNENNNHKSEEEEGNVSSAEKTLSSSPSSSSSTSPSSSTPVFAATGGDFLPMRGGPPKKPLPKAQKKKEPKLDGPTGYGRPFKIVSGPGLFAVMETVARKCLLESDRRALKNRIERENKSVRKLFEKSETNPSAVVKAAITADIQKHRNRLVPLIMARGKLDTRIKLLGEMSKSIKWENRLRLAVRFRNELNREQLLAAKRLRGEFNRDGTLRFPLDPKERKRYVMNLDESFNRLVERLAEITFTKRIHSFMNIYMDAGQGIQPNYHVGPATDSGIVVGSGVGAGALQKVKMAASSGDKDWRDLGYNPEPIQDSIATPSRHSHPQSGRRRPRKDKIPPPGRISPETRN